MDNQSAESIRVMGYISLRVLFVGSPLFDLRLCCQKRESSCDQNLRGNTSVCFSAFIG